MSPLTEINIRLYRKGLVRPPNSGQLLLSPGYVRWGLPLDSVPASPKRTKVPSSPVSFGLQFTGPVPSTLSTTAR